MVIDTKWKLIGRNTTDKKYGVSQHDVYQMMAYARLYRCRELLLLYPHYAALGEHMLDVSYIIMEGDERIRIASVDLIHGPAATTQQLEEIVSKYSF